jgi:GMP synthase (glutamine-hydrolysing)
VKALDALPTGRTPAGHSFAATRLDLGEPLPSVDDFDLLVIMGGGMNIYEHRDYPWLVDEKRLIARAAAREKAMLGVCLGAQLIADVLGGKVVQNPYKEIGWFPVRFIDRQPPFDGFPENCTVFHWHGDTFELPSRARRWPRAKRARTRPSPSETASPASNFTSS